MSVSAEDEERASVAAAEDEAPDEGEDSNLSPDIQRLTDGLLETFLPNVNKIREKLEELDDHQGKTAEHIHKGIARFEDPSPTQKLISVLALVPHYRIKLEGIRREMIHLHERTRKLKKRAAKLREQRRRDDAARKVAQEREREREKLLEAKLVAK